MSDYGILYIPKDGPGDIVSRGHASVAELGEALCEIFRQTQSDEADVDDAAWRQGRIPGGFDVNALEFGVTCFEDDSSRPLTPTEEAEVDEILVDAGLGAIGRFDEDETGP